MGSTAGFQLPALEETRGIVAGQTNRRKGWCLSRFVFDTPPAGMSVIRRTQARFR
jgi:hypothetical protein